MFLARKIPKWISRSVYDKGTFQIRGRFHQAVENIPYLSRFEASVAVLVLVDYALQIDSVVVYVALDRNVLATEVGPLVDNCLLLQMLTEWIFAMFLWFIRAAIVRAASSY
jgi:hypothetical protein